MNESQQERFEQQLLSALHGMAYPYTPDIAGAVMKRLPLTRAERRTSGAKSAVEARLESIPHLSRRLAWSLALLLVLCSSLMLIPPARAAILEFIQIGAVRIFRPEPAPLIQPAAEVPRTAAPGPTPTPAPLIPMLEELAGETTLGQAQQTVTYPIRLPSYPPDLGQPDRVFVQEADGKMTILVWMDPHQPGAVRLSLHFIPAGSWAIKKMSPQVIQETTVNGQHAVWAIGPYMLQLSNGNMDFTRLINGHVLIWTEGDLTYRLETNLSLEEALKVAGSLEPVR